MTDLKARGMASNAKEYAENSILAVNEELVTKASQSDLDSTNSNVALKADKTYVDSQVAVKADKSYVDTQVAVKADKSYVDTKAAAIASGSPKSTFATLALLQADTTANTTDGKKYIYLVTADGKWYYWNGSAWTAGGVYQSTGIAQKSINEYQVTFTSTSKNQFDKTTVTNGKYVRYNDGAIATGAVFSYSLPIPLSPNTKYIASSGVNDKQIAFFDVNNVYISGVLNVNRFTTPANVSYCILSAETADLDTVQLEKGTIATEYVSYYTINANKYLDDKSIKIKHLDFKPIVGIRSKNLFDKTTVTNGKYARYSDGTILNGSIFSYSDYIEVEPNIQYYLTDAYGDSQIAFYDVNKAYISGNVNFHLVTSPSSAAYCIISVETASLDKIQFEKGSKGTNYTSYYKIDPNNIDTTPIVTKIIVDINGTGDYTTIADAFAYCASNATQNNAYKITLKKGTYNEINLTIPAYTTLEGENIDECIIRSDGTIPPYDAMAWTAKHAIWCTKNATIKNLTIISNAVKYCIHSDSNCGEYEANFENLKLSNDQPCIGMGLYGGQFISIRNVECRYTGIGDWAYGLYMHNQNNQLSNCSLYAENVKAINCSILDLNNISAGETGQSDNVYIINCTSNLIDGGIWRRDNTYSESIKLNVVGDIKFIDVNTATIPNNNYHALGFYDEYVFNNTGSTILKGYGITSDYANSNSKTKAVKLANTKVDGVALKDIPNGQYGWVCMPKKVSYAFTNGVNYSKGVFYKCVNGLFTQTTEDLATAICLEDVVGGVIKSYVKIKLL